MGLDSKPLRPSDEPSDGVDGDHEHYQARGRAGDDRPRHDREPDDIIRRRLRPATVHRSLQRTDCRCPGIGLRRLDQRMNSR